MKSAAYQMDCMEALRQMPDKCFDLACVDPPYGLNAPKMNLGTNRRRRKGGYPSVSVASRMRAGGIESEWDQAPPSPDYFQELFRVSKNQIIFGGNYFRLPPTRGIGFWDKLQSWEAMSQFEYIWTSFCCPAFIIRCAGRGGANDEERIHVNQKPVKVYQTLFHKFAKPGDRVLDTHLGSGSSRIAAYDAGLEFVGLELNRKIFELGEARFCAHAAQENLFLGAGK